MGFMSEPSKRALDELCTLYERGYQSSIWPLYYEVWMPIIDQRAYDAFYLLWECLCAHLNDEYRGMVLTRIWWKWDVHALIGFLNIMEVQWRNSAGLSYIFQIRRYAYAELMGNDIPDIEWYIFVASLARVPTLRRKYADRIHVLSIEQLCDRFRGARRETLLDLLVERAHRDGNPPNAIKRILQCLTWWICENVYERWPWFCACFPGTTIEFPLKDTIDYTHRIYKFIQPLIRDGGIMLQTMYLRQALHNYDVGLVRMLLADFPELWSTPELRPMEMDAGPLAGPLARFLSSLVN